MSADDLLKRLEAAFLVSLVQDGITPDTQELLVHGNPLRQVKPGALSRALAGPAAEIRRLRAEVAHERAAVVVYLKAEASKCYEDAGHFCALTDVITAEGDALLVAASEIEAGAHLPVLGRINNGDQDGE